MYQTLIFWQDVANSKDATLKNPFASLLAEFDTTLKLELQVNDILFPLSFDLDQIGIFLAFHSLPLTRGPREEKRFNASWTMLKAYSSRQLPYTSSDNRERNTQQWNSKKKYHVRKKPLIHGCNWRDLVELSFVEHNAFCNDVTKPSPYDRQIQTNRHYMFREKNLMNSYGSRVWLTFAIPHRVEITFLFISFEHLKAKTGASITGLATKLTSDTSFW